MKRLYACDPTESLGQFVGMMARKLAQNDYKGGWDNMGALQLLQRLKQEVKELEQAIGTCDYEKIASEAADVANFAMMVQDKYWD